MKNFKIFCEGVTDQVFISDCLKIFYGFEPENMLAKPKQLENLSIKFSNGLEIIAIGGCNKISDPLYLSMLEDNQDLGGTNIVVFDADYTSLGSGNKGFDSCKRKLENIKRDKGINFEFFLWPNNATDGIVEDLLRKLIPNDKEVIYGCIESHQSCLASLSIPNIKIAELKDKIGYYLHTVNQDSRARNRDYKNTDYWNLNHAEVDYLQNLKSFFDSYFS